jgi:hypothetical protein
VSNVSGITTIAAHLRDSRRHGAIIVLVIIRLRLCQLTPPLLGRTASRWAFNCQTLIGLARRV